MKDSAALYDQLYSATGYRSRLAGYELARWQALRHFITRVVRPVQAKIVLDFGAGRGMHLPLWEELFPEALLYPCDVSQQALSLLQTEHPRHAHQCRLVTLPTAIDLPDGCCDCVVSVEVLEHVDDLEGTLREIHRLLAPGGWFIWTTPCANQGSIEHLYAWLTGQIDATPEGLRRFRWEDPTHVRRLTSAEIKERLHQCGFTDIRLRFRAHLFSFLCSRWLKRLPNRIKNHLFPLDYRLFRRMPNGASMLGAAQKSPNGSLS